MIDEPTKLSVSEIFHSVQGEGAHTGKPSIFIRLGGCNLSCVWCDTKYTWKPPIEITMPTFEQFCTTLKQYNCNHLVWTGGEPSLQIKTIQQYINTLSSKYTHDIESNGTVKFDPTSFQLCVISPKTLIGQEYKHNHVVQFEHFSQFPNVCFKFVIDSVEQFDKTLRLVEQNHIAAQKITFMPQATTPEQLKINSLWLIQKCKDVGIQFSTRLHVSLWGARRGV